MLEPGIMITLAATGAAAIVWAVRVEGRVNGHDTKFTDLEKLLEERDERLRERHSELTAQLLRIESKMDSGFQKGMKADKS